MHAEPSTVDLPARHYVALRGTVTVGTIVSIADRIPEVLGWLAERGTPSAGPPFLRYLVIDMDADLEIEAGVPVDEPIAGSGEVVPGVLPAGRYATVEHRGAYDGLVETIADLLAWAERRGLALDVRRDGAGDHWGCRFESYRTDPRTVPDVADWRTDVFLRLADPA